MLKEEDAKQCPWCFRWALKDNNCNYIFACGLDEKGVYHKNAGCGRSWCFCCGKKYCGQYIDLNSGKRAANAKDSHDNFCCTLESGFIEADYCCGGHSSHCSLRW